MSKKDFLNELATYLSYELPERIVRERLDYYDNYIRDEVSKGRAESDIIDELGDPQLIARSNIDSIKSGPDGIPYSGDDPDFDSEIYNKGTGSNDFNRGADRTNAGGADYDGANERDEGSAEGPKIILGGCFMPILIFLAAFLIFDIIGSILGFLSPVLVPICMVLLIMWLLGRRKQ